MSTSMAKVILVQAAKLSRTPREVEHIKDSETKWRAYRDSECRAQKGGDSCLVMMTAQRIASLKALYLER